MARRRRAKKENAQWRPAPLPSSFMLISIFGFIISAYSVYPRNVSWGIAFLILFAVMFVASLVSMVEADPDVEWELDHRGL